jgi:hypothetical protein
MFSTIGTSHHAEGLVEPKVRANKKVTDFGYPRAKYYNGKMRHIST